MRNKFIIILLTLTSAIGLSQNFNLGADFPQVTKPEASISSVMRFEEIPVSNYTGVPDINIPIYNIPTRSKDISLNISLGYHPSSVAMDEVAGECGKGWSLFSGGLISRNIIDQPDERLDGYDNTYESDIYQFNFFGHIGRFYIEKNNQGQLNLRILENENSKLIINLDYNPSTYVINSFTIYDDKGYKYLFQEFDTQTYHQGAFPIFSYRSTFHLTKVIDNNDKELINFSFDTYTQVLSSTYTNSYKKTKEISSNGYGKVNFNYSGVTNYTYNENIRISQLDLFDYNGVFLKKNKFLYLGTDKIRKIESCNIDETIKEVYEFVYKADYNLTDGIFIPDDWGYRKYVKNCMYSYPIVNVDSSSINDYCDSGVLSEIYLPAGGSINYKYESNTYSTFTKDVNGIWQLQDDPSYYYGDYNPENNIISTLAHHNFVGDGNNTFSFTVPGNIGESPKLYYFNVKSEPYTSETIDPAIYTGQPGEVFYPSIKLNDIFLSTVFNDLNQCLGQERYLNPGQTYTITINAFGDNNKVGEIHITKKENKPNPSKTTYAGGIRIKQIAYFDKKVPDYFNNIEYYNSIETFPSKSKSFSYNFFNQPDRSSGAAVYLGYDEVTNSRIKKEPVGYKNVTVTETGLGREEFIYTSPLDANIAGTDVLSTVSYDYRRGLLTNKKSFNESNNLLEEIVLSYDFVETPNSVIFFDNPALNERLGWAKLSQKIVNRYFSNSPIPVTTTENYIYNDEIRKIISNTQTNSLGETLKTLTSYHTGNSILSQNRISEVEKIETYRGTNLLFTKKINYGNSWSNNISYLPSFISGAKGSNLLENSLRYNRYDQYSNLTEFQKENGTVTTLIWGYNKTLPIAKIENATNSQVSTALGFGNVDLITETNLTAINNLRTNSAFANAMITTYTYKPLIGITTLTDPKGDKLTYEYDSFNRLKAVRDKNNNILKENEYYIAQNSQELNYLLTTNYKVGTITSIASPSINIANRSKTFLDGLGRPIQEIAHQQSNTGKDIVNHIEYDQYGRKVKDYLPYVTNAASLNFNNNAKNEILNFADYTGQSPYLERVFESSPLSRISEQGLPGSEWNVSNTDKHTIRTETLTNTSSDLVRLFRANSSEQNLAINGYYDISLIDSGFYSANELFKSVVKNENWKSSDGDVNTTITFTDKEGKIVLTRVYGASVVNGVEINTFHDTYNVYDQFGNLTYVIPPLADGVVNTAVLEGVCYQYRYDYRNRLVEKKIPGKQWEFILYDKLNRLVATGPSLSPFTDALPNTYGWLVTKYDAFNRNILTAWMGGVTTSAGRKSMQDSYNSTTLPLSESKSATNTSINNVAFRYSNLSLPTSNYNILTVNYFDNYSFPNVPAIPTTVMNDNSQAVHYNGTSNLPKGLLTGSWIRIVEASTTLPVKADINHVLYDNKARIVRAQTNNYLTGYTKVDMKIDFAGKTLYTETKHKRTSTSAEIYTREDFTYSNQDRLLTRIHKIGLTGTPQLLAKNEYDEFGKLKSKRVGGADVTGTTSLQKVDYSYNIRGWLTGINKVDGSTNPLSQGTDPVDLFAFKINYNTIEGNVVGVVPQYNGNISEVYWRTNSDNRLRKYGFQYDALNRLINATYQKPETNLPIPNSYRETLSYDKNGNIVNLIRNGGLDSETNYLDALQIDDLSYTYNHNQLQSVYDASGNPQGFNDAAYNTSEFGYDANGNMNRDDNKGIISIKYNHLNLPTEIIFNGTNKKINYLYNSSGQKVKKTVSVNSTTVYTTDYLGGFQYFDGVLNFFPQAEGYVKNTVVNGVNNYNYVFNYTDHQGNIRLSYGLNASNVLTIIEENHYYPYGLKHSSYNTEQYNYAKMANNTVNLSKAAPVDPGGVIDIALFKNFDYKYNGQEYQDELGLNMTAMGFRNYDNALGRFVGIDMLAEKNSYQSPYQFGNGNPALWSDPTGLDAIIDDDGVSFTGNDAASFFSAYLSLMDGAQSVTFTLSGSVFDHSGGGGSSFMGTPGFSFSDSYYGPGGIYYASINGNYAAYRYSPGSVTYYSQPQYVDGFEKPYYADVTVGTWVKLKGDSSDNIQTAGYFSGDTINPIQAYNLGVAYYGYGLALAQKALLDERKFYLGKNTSSSLRYISKNIDPSLKRISKISRRLGIAGTALTVANIGYKYSQGEDITYGDAADVVVSGLLTFVALSNPFGIVALGVYGLLDAGGAFDGIKSSLGGDNVLFESPH
ncbi:MAG: hypothetical protein J0L86_02740 [Flavobacteriales bacterium]|nr:hypothetical protein [Flavobacteriales bacterium]